MAENAAVPLKELAEAQKIAEDSRLKRQKIEPRCGNVLSETKSNQATKNLENAEIVVEETPEKLISETYRQQEFCDTLLEPLTPIAIEDHQNPNLAEEEEEEIASNNSRRCGNQLVPQLISAYQPEDFNLNHIYGTGVFTEISHEKSLVPEAHCPVALGGIASCPSRSGNVFPEKELSKAQEKVEDLQPKRQESELDPQRCGLLLLGTTLNQMAKNLENAKSKQNSETYHPQGYAVNQLDPSTPDLPEDNQNRIFEDEEEDTSKNNLLQKEESERRQGCKNESFRRLDQIDGNCESSRLSSEDRKENEPYALSRMQIRDSDVFLFQYQLEDYNPNHVYKSSESSESSDKEPLVPESSTEACYPVAVGSISSCSSRVSGYGISDPSDFQFGFTLSPTSCDNCCPYVLSSSSNCNDASRPALGNLEDVASWAESEGSCNCPLAVEDNVPANSETSLKSALIACARALSDADIEAARCLISDLEKMVSVHGKPIERVGAYTLEGLRARLDTSGSTIYKSLKKKALMQPNVLGMGCPYLKFAHLIANILSWEAVHNEPIIHIIDFQIADGSHWIPLISALANRSDGPPNVRITAVYDSQSAGVRPGLDNVLSEFAESCNVPLEFDTCTISLSDAVKERFRVQPGEAVVVNFLYVLHSIPDDSVNLCNDRDRLLRLVKSFSPKIVILTEQEANTNLTSFFLRFVETLDYYTAVCGSISGGSFKDENQRVDTEQVLVAPDIINIIACEGTERVERYEPFIQWKSQLMVAGFTQCGLSSSVTDTAKKLLKKYDSKYVLQEKDGALYLRWLDRALASCSAWR